MAEIQELQLVTAKEAGRILGIHKNTLWKMTKAGQIPCVRLGRAVRYDMTDLYLMVKRLKQRR